MRMGWVQHSWRFRHAQALSHVGTEMPERGSKTSTVPVVWATFGIFRSDPNDFLSRLVTMDETWLHHYGLETTQQSMEWWHSGSPRPKKFRVKKSAVKLLSSIFGDQDGIPLIDYLPKGQTINAECCSSLLGHLMDILKENAAGRSPKGPCSCTTMPRLTGHLQPRWKWPTGLPLCWSHALFSESGPVGLPPVPRTWKTI